MALDTNATLLANLIDPEVFADFIDSKLIDNIRLTPLATVDTTLVGRPGSKIQVPFYTYIGDATVVNEGADIPIAQLTQDTKEAEILKVGRGVQITDEAILSSLGDPVGEAARQLVMSIASKVEADMYTKLNGITGTMKYTGTIDADGVADALIKFGEDIDGQKALLVNPTTYAVLRKADNWLPASEIAANIWLRGAVGEIQGCQVIVSNRVPANTAFIVKPGALALYLKRDTMVETDRDIINKTTYLTADKHFVCYLLDESKAIKMATT